MPAVKGDSMRGLAVFISDIRNCKSKEAEVKRINKELANIRSKFKGDKTMDGYQKKKYVSKLLFIFLLGHDIDFGHMEAVNLLSSIKYTEKQIGYLFISVLISENNDLIRLVIQNLKNDLSSRNPVHVQLALQCIANIGSKDMCDVFVTEIPKLLVSGDTIDSVKQSAALCLLKLFRTILAEGQTPPLGEWTLRVVHLLNDQHMGVVTAAVSLINCLVKLNPDDYKGCVSLTVSRLSRIVTSSYTDLQDYTYYFVPAPWLSVKLLRLLQNYPPSEDAAVRSRLTDCLETILNKAQEPPKSKKVQHGNAKNAVLFEAINLIIHMDSDPNLLVRACNQLGTFLQHRETNLRYLALESLCLLATSEFSHEAVKKHQDTVVNALKTERDVSVRQRAVDMLYAMCDRSNAEEIVHEMLQYLETADYSIREEMVLKVAILAEKYATEYSWYVDVILNLIRVAGDYVSEEVWHRVIQIVINRDDVQGYAAKTVFGALQAPACHENMVKVGGYILGEFGNLIAGDPRSSPLVQFKLLHEKFHLCSLSTRQLLLSTYVKFINLFPEIKLIVQDVLKNDANLRNSDVEIQQRSTEYFHLTNIASTDVLATVLEEMPPFPERESSILRQLRKKKPAVDEHGNRTTSNSESRSTSVPAARISETSHAATPTATEQTVQLSGGGAAFGESSTDADLLGIETSPVMKTNTGASHNIDLLADILSIPASSAVNNSSSSSHAVTSGPMLATTNGDLKQALLLPGATATAGQDTWHKFVVKNNGVLFENDLLQIGVKAEYRQSQGRITMFYGNKTMSQLSQFSSEVTLPDTQLANQLNIQVKSPDRLIEAGAQMQQVLSVELLEEFIVVPLLSIAFYYCGTMQQLNVALPLTVNKFLSAAEMDSPTFFQRWKLISEPGQECQKIFPAKFGMDATATKTKILGFGFSLLIGIDPNPENFVGAAILHLKSSQIGCLFRLEPNLQAKMYRLTVHSTREMAAQRLCNLLEAQL